MTTDRNQPVDEIRVAIVMPCLNEEENLTKTCASLGFGIGKELSPPGAVLILVDNGSTDSTVSVAEQVRGHSRAESVIIGHETERGFVPPRHRGVLMANALARSINWSPDSVLLLQADADTIYADGYVASMRLAAARFGPDVMIEAHVGYPPDFKAQYPEYIRMCEEIDNEFVDLFPRDLTDDEVVDDKVSGYWLGDYLKWGGHRREYTQAGEEIHAETTRLYMRAKALGARRERVDNALGFHSPRRILEDPAMVLAAAGFPREASWKERWHQAYHGPSDLRALCSQPLHPEVLRVIETRELHLLALLSLLPLHVDRALGRGVSIAAVDFADLVLSWLPRRAVTDLLSRPGVFLTDVFELIERNGDALLNEARRVTPQALSRFANGGGEQSPML